MKGRKGKGREGRGEKGWGWKGRRAGRERSGSKETFALQSHPRLEIVLIAVSRVFRRGFIFQPRGEWPTQGKSKLVRE